MTTFFRIVVTGSLCLLTLAAICNAECKPVLEVREVVKNAQTLDGKVICVWGMLVPNRIPELGSSLMQELVPFSMKGRQEGNDKVGLIDWSPETGISEEQYKPESFDLLLAQRQSPQADMSHRLDVTVRGALVYKKNLRAKVPSVRPNTPQTQSMREARYDVELVLLEIVRVKNLGENKTGR